MKTKKELISIAKNIEMRENYDSLFKYACTYLFGMKKRGITETSEFFEMLRYSEERPRNVKKHFGISGKGNDDLIKNWCGLMLRYRNSFFAGLSIDELRQLFGYCSYEAKIKKEL
ncbi:MAG: hypothetical protein IJZ65_04905 [Ruminiclostridium sp.]|nr:hypothetical protein [Ruminiclostridium sp.]MBQ8841953.1 hypothetical protein [Ruminiclostridium sp.]